MARKPTSHIYRQRNGNGWVMTTLDGLHDGDKQDGVLIEYRIGNDGPHVSTRPIAVLHKGGHRQVQRRLRSLGAELGPYPAAGRPKPNTDFEDQPRKVRMQRHAYDMYEAVGHVRGMSETIAVRAAAEFGSTWADKTDTEPWEERVTSVGEGRASRIVSALERL